MKMSEMPHVTVEQVLALRKAAIELEVKNDQLTAINQELVEALEYLELAVSCDKDAFLSPSHQNARAVIKRAKELTK